MENFNDVCSMIEHITQLVINDEPMIDPYEINQVEDEAFLACYEHELANELALKLIG